MSRQLYRVVSDVDVPENARYDARADVYKKDGMRHLTAMVFMSWPNRFPCIEVNLHLNALADSLRTDETGGSLKEVAAQLSHIVRFCWEHEGIRRNFWDLDSASYEEFLKKMQQEKDSRRPGKDARQTNRVREISETTLKFLKWLQENVLIDRKLVGLSGEGFAIGLEEVREPNRFGSVTVKQKFPFRIMPSARDPKPAMAMETIEKLWLVISQKADINHVDPVYRKRFKSEEDLEVILHFLQRRRECMLHLMQAAGMRPFEQQLCSAKKNIEVSLSLKLITPTAKREIGAERGIPLRLSTAVIIDLYAECRNDYLSFLKGKGRNPDPGDALFINERGAPMSRSALTKEFQRLCTTAGLSTRTCLSMFRHRFITLMVALELNQVLEEDQSFPVHSLAFADYRTILTRVAAITGHADPASLMVYVHLAWDELKWFAGVDAVRELVMALEEVRALRRVYCDDSSGERKVLTRDELKKKTEWFDAVMQALVASADKIVARQQSEVAARTVHL